VEKAGVDSRGGICRSDNGWKAVIKKESRAYDANNLSRA